jgi:hypothetical protein
LYPIVDRHTNKYESSDSKGDPTGIDFYVIPIPRAIQRILIIGQHQWGDGF